MIKTLQALIFVLLASGAAAQSLVDVITAPRYSYGLTHDGTNLWIGASTGGKIWKIDPSNGARLDSFTAVTNETRGLGWDGADIWGYQYIFGSTAANKDKIIKYILPGGTPGDTLYSPYEDYIGGMCYANGFLWISVYYTGSGNPARLVKIDAATGIPVDTLIAPGLQPQGIAFDGHALWVAMDDNDGDPERIWQIDMTTGDTLRSFPIPPYASTVTASPKDMAYHDGFLYLVVGPSTNKAVYKFSVNSSGTPKISLSANQIIFPYTAVGDSSVLNLRISNIGDADLAVDSLKINNAAFLYQSAAAPIIIPPEGYSDVAVKFKPGGFNYYTGQITVYSTDPISPSVSVQISGQGLFSGPKILLTEETHNFGTVWIPADGNSYWSFGIINAGNQTLQVSSLSLSLPEFLVVFENDPVTVIPNDTVFGKIRFTPSQQGIFLDTLLISSNDPSAPVKKLYLSGSGNLGNYDYGFTFWQMTVPDNPNTTADEFRVEGLKTINDITGDGIREVIAATDNYWLLCLDGAGSGTTEILWSFNSYITNYNAGSIGQSWDYGVQDALGIASDLNGDGFNDVVIGTGGGNEHVYALNGKTGEIIWQFGDENNYGLGDFEAVDVQRDFNEDGVPDVLAIADGNDTGTGYKRAFLFNGINGNIIWEYFYPGPNPAFGKTILSVDDVTTDGKPDAVIAVGNNGTANLTVYCLNGTNGQPYWSFNTSTYEPKELLEFPVNGSNPDIIAAEYFGRIYRIDGKTGTQVWVQTLGSLAGVIQMALIPDLNGDGADDILVAAFTSGVTCLSGETGQILWAYGMNYQYGVAAVPDLNNDGLWDVVTGDQDGVFYCVSGNGTDLLFSHSFPGDRINTVNVIPSIDGNYSYELLCGTKNGAIACFSGGLNAVPVELVSFTAGLSGTEVRLDWTTATELNNSGFYVQRNSGSEVKEIAFIEGGGSTSGPRHYSYMDDVSSINGLDRISYRIKQVDFGGICSYSEWVEVSVMPGSFGLSQNYPNPFNPSTKISFSIAAEGLVTLKIFNTLGEEIATLVNEIKKPGFYTVDFHSGNLPSGIYFYTLEAGRDNGFIASKKMLLIK